MPGIPLKPCQGRAQERDRGGHIVQHAKFFASGWLIRLARGSYERLFGIFEERFNCPKTAGVKGRERPCKGQARARADNVRRKCREPSSQCLPFTQAKNLINVLLNQPGCPYNFIRSESMVQRSIYQPIVPVPEG